MRKIIRLVFLIAIFAFASTSVVHAVEMWGIMTNPDPAVIVTFDSADPGTFTVVGSTGIIDFPSGLDFDSSGNLYLSTQISDGGDLYSIDQLSGAPTLIGGYTGLDSGYEISDLSWDPLGERMLALANGGLDISPIVYSVDLASAALTSIGTIPGITDGFEVSLAVAQNGFVYIHSIRSDRWYRVDPSTLAATALNFLPFDSNGGQGVSSIGAVTAPSITQPLIAMLMMESCGPLIRYLEMPLL
jgi:hypothetical protein